MYFKRLELVGFKSFMDKTDLNFEPGITAIVGPNGCGKSNIFDSIRWVLGEQSVKSLRGSQMEDVIFNGTDTKQPLGMAEVSLTFDNSQKQFPVDHDEVLITRRIFRSGESEYLLNKSQVRLKDIQELLLGTGIGAESYSIIAQGKIDLILSSKPEDRRQVFDEASGITKYKAQKREAMRRLEETEQNLLRINDIITEVKRSIGYLERQANKARRYQASFAELKNKEVHLSFLQKNALVAQKYEVTKELTDLKERQDSLVAEIKGAEAGIAQHNQELSSLEADRDRIKNAIMTLETGIQSNTQHIQFNHERIKELESTTSYLSAQITQTRDRLAQEEDKLRTFKEEHLAIKQSLEEKTVSLQANQAQLSDLIEGIRVSTENIAKAKRSILELATKAAQAHNEISEVTSKQQVYLARQKRLELEKAKVAEERTFVEGNLGVLNQELAQMEQAHATLAQERASVKTDADQTARALALANQEIDELEKHRLSLESQREFLERLKSQYDGISESMNATIYLDKVPLEATNGLVIKVKADTLQQTPSGFSLHGEAKPIDLDAQKVKEQLLALEGQLAILRDNKTELESAIQCITATLEMLTQKEQDEELTLSNKRTVQQTVVDQFNKIKTEEEVILLELSDVQAEMATVTEKLRHSQEHLAAIEAEDKAVEDTIHREQEHISANSKLKEEVLVAIAQVKTEAEAIGKRLAAEEANLRMLEDAVRISRENILTLENKIRETLHRQEGLTLQIKDLEQKISLARNDIEAQRDLLSSTEQAYARLSASISGTITLIEGKKNLLQTYKDNIYEIQMQEKDLDFKYQSIRERLSTAYKIDLDAVVARIQTKDDQAAALNESQIAQASPPAPGGEQDTPDQGAQETEAAPAQSGPAGLVFTEVDETALAQEIEKLKEKVDSYGTVNLVAIEEYDELKKRYDFLTQQQTDLVTAKESLQEAIRKINHTTRKMFLETFEKVREEFRTYFKQLFNGGDAQVYLIDENDPLETGIEIICRPPGKKLQNVLLLSGGEKALSAIALIFAIFKVKPAPFCVLDEIDAALDEANVERFGRLLQDFAATSQFIVITHNKRTIANADIMYGITMQESGVSKIVSVKFSQNKPNTQKDTAPEPVAA